MRRPFYGWVIVGVSFLIGFTESGVFQNILAIFMKPMVDEFGWTRASITGSIAFGSICGGFLSLIVGPMLDRYGPRLVSFGSILILSAGLFAMTFARDIWHLYLFFGVGRMVAVGVLSLATSVSIANWFVRLRGRAMGIAKIGDRLGGALLPLMVQFLILSLGWRMAWGSLAIVVFLISGIPSLLFLRQRPEEMGLVPDGTAGDANKWAREFRINGGEQPDLVEPVWTRKQATRTKAFWVLTILSSLIPFSQAGTNFHIYPFLTDQGLSETTAVFILSTVALSGMAGSVIWGMLAERFHIQKLLMANVIGSGLVFLFLFWIVNLKWDNPLGIGLTFLLASLHGAIQGGRIVILPLIWSDFFGYRSLGSIYGLSNPFYFAANAIGPVFAGLCFDLYGSYSFPFYFFVGVYFIAGLIAVRAQRPSSLAKAPAPDNT